MISHSLEALNVSNFMGIFAHFLSIHMYIARVLIEKVVCILCQEFTIKIMVSSLA